MSTRAEKIEAAARAVIGGWGRVERDGPQTPHSERINALDAALALPADLVSVDERERQLVRIAVKDALAAQRVVMAGHTGLSITSEVSDGLCDDIIAVVNATHPRAPSVEAHYPFARASLTENDDARDVSGLVRPGDPGGTDRVGDDGSVRRVPASSAEVTAYKRGREDAARVCDDAATGAVDPGGIRRCAARIRALAPDCENCGEPSCTSSDCVRAIETAAPSAPRDQGGGLREWFSRVLRNAAERGLIVSQDETGIDAALAEVGPPPPTDGVAAAYERVRIAAAYLPLDSVDGWAWATDEHTTGSWVRVGLLRAISALAALVSEKERAK